MHYTSFVYASFLCSLCSFLELRMQFQSWFVVELLLWKAVYMPNIYTLYHITEVMVNIFGGDDTGSYIKL